jgi:HK97 gp10 family phage protein
MMDIKLDPTLLYDALDAFENKIKTNVIRVGSQAAAQVFCDEAKSRVRDSKEGHWFHGKSFKKNGQKYWFDSGTLRNSIYQVYSKDNSSEGRATYHVAWNHIKCPYGFMVEFGTSRAAAHPFLRSAYDAVKQQAYDAAVAKMKAVL